MGILKSEFFSFDFRCAIDLCQLFEKKIKIFEIGEKNFLRYFILLSGMRYLKNLAFEIINLFKKLSLVENSI